MDRPALLAALIAFDRPLAELRAGLDALDPPARAVATVRREDVVAILRRYLAGQLDAGSVSDWAALVESREDLEFEPRHEEAVSDALADLAYPEGEFSDVAEDLLAYLGG
jgi:hypothetical protein